MRIPRRSRLLLRLGPLALLFVAATPATGQERLRKSPVAPSTESQDQTEEDLSLLLVWAPRFEVREGARPFNRIGSPRLSLRNGKLRARIDPESPALFSEIRHDDVAGRSLLHLVYRIHFTRLPFTASVFFERHSNVGLLALVTLDALDHEPLFLTTVYTCGCYCALLPTRNFPKAQLPKNWPSVTKKVFGKRLPAEVPVPEPGTSHWVIHMASRTHRVDGITIAADTSKGNALPLVPMSKLRNLPIEGAGAGAGAPGQTASFFYTSGFLKGHVRGSFSPIEGLTAGLFLLDPLLGMDKDFGDPAITGTRFYTGLLPWQRNISRLDRFDPLLRSLGFRFAPLPSVPAPRLPAEDVTSTSRE